MKKRSLLLAALVFHPELLTAQLPDTIRVGSVALFPMPEGTDTMDIVFESRSANGTLDKRQSINVVHRTREQLNGEAVLHVRFGSDQPNRFDFYVDPHTMAMRRFEQRTAIDSAIVTFRDACASGWVDLQNEARRLLTCEPTARGFGASPIDEHVVALLPLRNAASVTLVTYAPIGGGIGPLTYRVTGAETLQLGGRRIDAWRVERVVTTSFGAYTTTLWIDQHKHRIVQAKRDFGNGRVSTMTLRNP